MAFADLWRDLQPLGRDPETGGYRRYSYTDADARCRAWFTSQAERRGLTVEPDRNGNLWAWWGPRGAEAIATGSHLDSVPDGGGFDGALGVVSALAAVDLLKEKNFYPERSVVLVAFTEEEGARFGVPCLGSRLVTGVMDPETARALTDDHGVTLAEAMAGAGYDPALIGPDEQRLSGLAAFVELHVEQGRALAPLGAPVGLAEAIWPHGRWRLEFTGRADHAGTARLADRSDPMLPYASTVLAAREAAAAHGALATFGKVIAQPGGSNGVSSSVGAWLDARAPDEATLAATVTTVRSAAERSSAEQGVTLTVREESYTPLVSFDPALRDRIAAVLAKLGLPPPVPPAGPGGDAGPPPAPPAGPGRDADVPAAPVPVLPTGAGHDAGVLAARVPTAMLFVRNPTGVSHSPAEHADLSDCEAGVRALAAVLGDLA
jgi:beta-ureidopropionase / N-carbamoyl-L-amino-acid hydrolase